MTARAVDGSMAEPPAWMRPPGAEARRRARLRVLSVIAGIMTAVLLASGLVVVLDRWLK
jgi:hypothetical protein